MKVVFSDEKQGVAKLAIESEDDLWHLSNIAVPGLTRAKMRTARKVKKEFGGGERSESDKVALTLEIAVEKVEYHPFSGALRISGKVCGENETVPLGTYHTFSVEPGDAVTIQKEGGLGPLDWERLRASRRAQPKVLVLLMDRDETNFATVSGEGVNWTVEVRSSLPPKGDKSYEPSMREYFGSVLAALKSLSGRAAAVIVAGPGNVKDNFADFAAESGIRLQTQNASSATRAALKEILESGVSRVLEDSSVAEENKAVEEVFALIGRGSGKVAYGRAEVAAAAEAGAVEKILVSESLVKSSRLAGTFGELEKTIKSVEGGGGSVKIVSETHEAGKKLAGLGGVAAVLRYSFSSTNKD